jgi:hypothetical protein
VVRLYRLRWRIEEVFRILKSNGLKIEDSQLETADRLFNLAAFGLVAAARIIQLVDSRDGSTRPATDVIEADEIKAAAAISATLEGDTERQKNPHKKGTLAWLSWIAARLGGWNCYYKPPGPRPWPAASIASSTVSKALGLLTSVGMCESRRGISRGSVYYEPVAVSESDLALMRRLDALHLEHPHAGSRMLRDLLAAEGTKISRHAHGVDGIEAVYCRPRTSATAPGHKIYPYLLRGLTIDRANQVGDGHNVHPDGARLRLSCRRHGLVRASHSGLATVDHARCGLLHRRARGGFAPPWQAGDSTPIKAASSPAIRLRTF